MTKLTIRLKGGAGSGNHGHKGRPGEVGGSLPQGESQSGRKTNKINRREVHSPDDKLGDLPGIRTRIPNEDRELSHGSAQETYAAIFRDDPSNVEENMKILHSKRLAADEDEEMQVQDAYEQVLDDITNQMYDIADELKKMNSEPTITLLLRDYQKINNIKFNKKEREDLKYMLAEGSFMLGNEIAP